MTTNYLPGLSATLNDYGLRVFPPSRGTKVTLLGFVANTGIPLFEPLSVTSVGQAMALTRFDATGLTGISLPGELSLAMEQVSDGGVTNIEIMAIGYLKDIPGYTNDGIGLARMYVPTSGVDLARQSGLHDAYQVLKHHPIDIVVPVNACIDSRWATFGPQLANFCYEATAAGNPAVGVIQTMSPLAWATVVGFSGNETVGGLARWQVGLTGLSSSLKTELESLFGTYGGAAVPVKARSILFGSPSSTLINYYVRYHSLPTDPVWHGASAEEETVAGTVGAFSTLYPSNYAAWLSGAVSTEGYYRDTATYASNLSQAYWAYWQITGADLTDKVDALGNRIDAGAYINVVTTVTSYYSAQSYAMAVGLSGNPSYSSLNLTPAAAYAGKIASLPSQSATTNKAINNVVQLKAISASQASDLTSFRHVTMYNRSVGFTVSKDSTGAHNMNKYVRSDYTLLTTVRIAHEVVQRVKAIGEKYIGEPNSTPQRNALYTDIDQELMGMKKAGSLQDYNFVITATPDQQVLGEADISLTIVPAFELLQLNLYVSLAKTI